jgi:hypothetical protein
LIAEEATVSVVVFATFLNRPLRPLPRQMKAFTSSFAILIRDTAFAEHPSRSGFSAETPCSTKLELFSVKRGFPDLFVQCTAAVILDKLRQRRSLQLSQHESPSLAFRIRQQRRPGRKSFAGC